MTNLGNTIANICRVIPDGVVVFFPSYDYLSQVLTTWKKSRNTSSTSIFERLKTIKTVLHESKDRTTSIDDLLQEYSDSIMQGTGALLFAVMGGKLSEGINFSDELGRGVIVVGLPFPNARSAMWQAKMGHVERKAYESCQEGTKEEVRNAKARSAGREFYENSCMRTVNQCIGRAIRHQGDYAAIVMIDRRYGTPRIQSKLPNWIRQSMVEGSADRIAERAIEDLSGFFRRRKIAKN